MRNLTTLLQLRYELIHDKDMRCNFILYLDL